MKSYNRACCVRMVRIRTSFYRLFAFLTVVALAVACIFWRSHSQIASRIIMCAHENVKLIDPQWKYIKVFNKENGYNSEPLVVIDDYLIIANRDDEAEKDRVQAYNLKTGQVTWSALQEFAGGLETRTLVITDQYIANYDSRPIVTVFDTTSGQIVLERPSGFIYSLAMDAQHLFIHDYWGHVRAYELPGGNLVWDRALSNGVESGLSHLLPSKEGLIISQHDKTQILDPSNGEVKKQFSIDKGTRPNLYEGKFLVTSDQTMLRASSIDTGELI
jgi:outer membrane protein assembly factor BamB